MANPIPFVPDYSYTDYQETAPADPLPGPQVDNDFADVAASTVTLVNAVKDVRRSDGRLKNGIVTYDSLSADVQARLSGAISVTTYNFTTLLTYDAVPGEANSADAFNAAGASGLIVIIPPGAWTATEGIFMSAAGTQFWFMPGASLTYTGAASTQNFVDITAEFCGIRFEGDSYIDGNRRDTDPASPYYNPSGPTLASGVTNLSTILVRTNNSWLENARVLNSPCNGIRFPFATYGNELRGTTFVQNSGEFGVFNELAIDLVFDHIDIVDFGTRDKFDTSGVTSHAPGMTGNKVTVENTYAMVTFERLGLEWWFGGDYCYVGFAEIKGEFIDFGLSLAGYGCGVGAWHTFGCIDYAIEIANGAVQLGDGLAEECEGRGLNVNINANPVWIPSNISVGRIRFINKTVLGDRGLTISGSVNNPVAITIEDIQIEGYEIVWDIARTINLQIIDWYAEVDSDNSSTYPITLQDDNIGPRIGGGMMNISAGSAVLLGGIQWLADGGSMSDVELKLNDRAQVGARLGTGAGTAVDNVFSDLIVRDATVAVFDDDSNSATNKIKGTVGFSCNAALGIGGSTRQTDNVTT